MFSQFSKDDAILQSDLVQICGNPCQVTSLTWDLIFFSAKEFGQDTFYWMYAEILTDCEDTSRRGIF